MLILNIKFTLENTHTYFFHFSRIVVEIVAMSWTPPVLDTSTVGLMPLVPTWPVTHLMNVRRAPFYGSSLAWTSQIKQLLMLTIPYSDGSGGSVKTPETPPGLCTYGSTTKRGRSSLNSPKTFGRRLLFARTRSPSGRSL